MTERKLPARNTDATAVVPMGSTAREGVYRRQNGGAQFTPPQRRRLRHKRNRMLRGAS